MGFLNGAVDFLNWAWTLWGWGAVEIPGGVCMDFLGGVCGNSGDRAGSVDFLNWAVDFLSGAVGFLNWAVDFLNGGCVLSGLGSGEFTRAYGKSRQGQWAFRTQLWDFSILICGF